MTDESPKLLYKIYFNLIYSVFHDLINIESLKALRNKIIAFNILS